MFSMILDDRHGDGSSMDYAHSALIPLAGELQVIVEAMVMRPREGEEAWEVDQLSSLQAPSDFSESYTSRALSMKQFSLCRMSCRI